MKKESRDMKDITAKVQKIMKKYVKKEEDREASRIMFSKIRDRVIRDMGGKSKWEKYLTKEEIEIENNLGLKSIKSIFGNEDEKERREI